ncbi:MAG TPA: polysaccharide deacetylase family protein, partial [Tepidisphaeraceae bacterium]|nr:polysaccharide deacetylase family protein [Tepidisphaeraceae bacterium]
MMIPVWASATFSGLSVFAGIGLYGTFVPGCRLWGSVTSRGSETQRQVALTFDDGPTEGGSDRILDRLAELRVPATFFVIGRHVQERPQLVKRMFDEGHVVGNHSFHHAHFGLFRGPAYWRNEIGRTDDLIAEVIGRRPGLFRPPMGFLTWPIHRAARRTGHAVIAWSQRGRDGVTPSTDEILRRLGKP